MFVNVYTHFDLKLAAPVQVQALKTIFALYKDSEGYLKFNEFIAGLCLLCQSAPLSQLVNLSLSVILQLKDIGGEEIPYKLAVEFFRGLYRLLRIESALVL